MELFGQQTLLTEWRFAHFRCAEPHPACKALPEVEQSKAAPGFNILNSDSTPEEPTFHEFSITCWPYNINSQNLNHLTILEIGFPTMRAPLISPMQTLEMAACGSGARKVIVPVWSPTTTCELQGLNPTGIPGIHSLWFFLHETQSY